MEDSCCWSGGAIQALAADSSIAWLLKIIPRSVGYLLREEVHFNMQTAQVLSEQNKSR
jgi:hypothetical protein